jgi:type II secretory pathway pseudopilin PulG
LARRSQTRLRRRGRHEDRRRGDDGITLIEIVITISLLGLVVVPILVAVTTSIKSSRVSESAAQVETLLVNAVDRVNRAPYEGAYKCVLTGAVQAAAEAAGWPASSATVGHEYLDKIDGTWKTDSTFGTACPNGVWYLGIVQRITITVTSPDGGVSRSLQVVRGDLQ